MTLTQFIGAALRAENAAIVVSPESHWASLFTFERIEFSNVEK